MRTEDGRLHEFQMVSRCTRRLGLNPWSALEWESLRHLSEYGKKKNAHVDTFVIDYNLDFFFFF